jgi:peptidoglycan/LPS O-acetylase OafA/YrhL
VLALVAIAGFTFLSIAARGAGDKYAFTWLTSPPAIMYVFMPGVAVAILEPLLVDAFRDRASRARLVAWGAFAAAALCVVAYSVTDYDVRQTPIHHALGQRALIAALSTGALIFGLVVLQLGTGRAPRLFGNRVMLWMGARSYSFYLVHIWILFELDQILARDMPLATRVILMTVIALPITTLVAALSYRYVERPFLERKRRVAVGGSGDPPPAAEPLPVAVGPAR